MICRRMVIFQLVMLLITWSMSGKSSAGLESKWDMADLQGSVNSSCHWPVNCQWRSAVHSAHYFGCVVQTRWLDNKTSHLPMALVGPFAFQNNLSIYIRHKNTEDCWKNCSYEPQNIFLLSSSKNFKLGFWSSWSHFLASNVSGEVRWWHRNVSLIWEYELRIELCKS